MNGQQHEVRVATDETLLETLRNQLELMSVRGSCGVGVCGSCTVLIDGKPICACLTLSALADGVEITTAEGLVGHDGRLDPVQEAFINHSAFQCSYCTPAIVLTTRAMLNENPKPTREEILEHLSGNLCRCGSYLNVLEAIESLTGQSGTR